MTFLRERVNRVFKMRTLEKLIRYTQDNCLSMNSKNNLI